MKYIIIHFLKKNIYIVTGSNYHKHSKNAWTDYNGLKVSKYIGLVKLK